MSTSKKAVVVSRGSKSVGQFVHLERVRLLMCEVDESGVAIVPERITDRIPQICEEVNRRASKRYGNTKAIMERLADEINAGRMSFKTAKSLDSYLFRHDASSHNRKNLEAFLAPAGCFKRIKAARAAGVDFVDLVAGSMSAAA
ncbi:hypothetical protein [Streptomyces sp. NPDC047972]|uniref:hypothetical protein n=1 Tax=Streptomyces sp. NPDC047972 TaxID=3365493 RepID=UPI003711203B